MPTYTFPELKTTAKKRVSCDMCGKKVNRQRTFTQTLNPYNRNSDGDPKTSQEIYAELAAEAEAWKAKQDGEQCTPCYNTKWGIKP